MNQSNLNLPALPIGQRWVVKEERYGYIVVSLEELHTTTRFARTGWLGKKEEKTISDWKDIGSEYITSYTSDNLARRVEQKANHILNCRKESTRLKGVLQEVKGVYEPTKV
jgi:hypothetical protein